MRIHDTRGRSGRGPETPSRSSGSPRPLSLSGALGLAVLTGSVVLGQEIPPAPAGEPPAPAASEEGPGEPGPPAPVETPAEEPAEAAVAAGNRADYRIEATLDGETHRLNGRLELRWTNGSADPVQDLWFHLYLNAFSNNRSTHLREAKGKLRGVEIEDGWGWSRVSAVRALGLEDGGPQDLMPTFRYRAPDDGNAEDRTVFSVDLPRPVQPGETIRVEVEWESQLPRVRRRTGYKDDFLLVAQWFPKLGVYESGRGWNCHQFHMNSEFYSDYGIYDVSLDLPVEYRGKVFGSGIVENERSKGGRLDVRFVAPSTADQLRVDSFGKHPLVHDFTWTADTRYVVKQFIFDPSEWAERYPDEVERARRIFGPDEDLNLRKVDVTILIHPERIDQVERHFKATCAALFFYGLWFGEYPYQHVTVVDPAWGARAAGGMEYPTLFTCGTRLFTTEDMYVPESVTVHECGHQFWYGLVGNNEFEAAWLDEGFNSYTDSEVLWRVYGPRRSTTDYARVPVSGVPLGEVPGQDESTRVLALRDVRIPLPWFYDPHWKPLRASGFVDWWRDQPRLTFVPQWTDPRWADRSGYLRDPSTDPIDTAAWLYADRTSYSTNSYPRTAVALRSLAAVVGEGPFLRGMRHYARTWRYRHPYPDDFFRTFQEGAQVDLDWYFEELFRGRGTVDWEIRVDQRPRPEVRGFVQSEGGTFLERPEPEGMEEEADERPYWTEVQLRNRGTLALPVPVRLTFRDAEGNETVEEVVWTREEQQARSWKKLEFERREKLVSAVIDPERSYYIDADMSNNAWYEAKDRLAPWRWSERILSQCQRYLHWIGGIGG